MNDNELITTVRQSVADVHTITPVGQIMSRGRAARARRRIPVLTGALGVAAATVLAVTTLLTASHPAASHPASGHDARLAAFAVTRQADGSIQVSMFHQLRDAAELQQLQGTLRADGIPASVTFIGQQNPACQAYRMPPSDQPISRSVRQGGFPNSPLSGVLGSPFQNPVGDAMVIHPAALPRGSGLQIAVMRGIPARPGGPWPYPKGSGHAVVSVGLVNASPQCTGS
jgi:hypothetical protein